MRPRAASAAAATQRRPPSLKAMRDARFRYFSGAAFACMHPPVRFGQNRQGDHHMIRPFFAVAVIALGVGVALAQQDPIKARRALMKANGDEAKIGAAMAKGEMPFDLAKARKMFATFEDASAKAPSLFPDNSKSGGDTAAKAEIWENLDDFKARLVKLGTDAKAAMESVTDLDTFKAAFGSIGKNDCGGCHEKYRVKKT
jgi:cytochrome c556